MGKKLTPHEKVDKFITKCYITEVDKWNAGLSNSMEEWENFVNNWKMIDEIAYYRNANAELRMYNEKLKEQIKRMEANRK